MGSGRLGSGTAVPILCGGIAVLVLAFAGCGKDNNPASHVPSIAESMVLIHPGTFQMGSPADEAGRQADEVLHAVTLTRPYSLCDHEVTQSEWQDAMGGDPSFFHGGSRPVDSVSWLDAVKFCNRLSSHEGLQPAYTILPDTVIWTAGSNGYRLPTEAEWEYACRAESTSAFCNGAILNPGDNCEHDAHLDRVGWYCANYSGRSHDVRSKDPNAWGLYDMHGNVWEWCWDWIDGAYAQADTTDPTGPADVPDDSLRVARGGSWGSHARFCRSAVRYGVKPYAVQNYIGLRVARNAEALPRSRASRIPTRP